MDIFSHELSAYKLEIEKIRDDLEGFKNDNSIVENVTHFGLGISNRGHLIIIGLCSLVEIYLYELAKNEQEKQVFKLSDISGQGITKLQTYLTKTAKLDFGRLKYWPKFKAVYDLRNTFVHSYGGLIESSQISKAKKSLRELEMEGSLVAERRIRLTYDNLVLIHNYIEQLILEFKSQT